MGYLYILLLLLHFLNVRVQYPTQVHLTPTSTNIPTSSKDVDGTTCCPNPVAYLLHPYKLVETFAPCQYL